MTGCHCPDNTKIFEKKYKCERHGILDASERVVWARSFDDKRWCLYCVEEMMNKHCCRVFEIEENQPNGEV